MALKRYGVKLRHMLNAASTQTSSSAASRTSGTPHVFVTPVVREIPLATEPASCALCW